MGYEKERWLKSGNLASISPDDLALDLGLGYLSIASQAKQK